MFEAAEVGRAVSREEFRRREPELRLRLLEAQREIAGARVPVVVIVSGVEGAGKGEVVNRLHEWLDSRGLETQAFWDESDEERERPRFWRFWRHLPARGRIGVFFGSWYSDPIVRRAFGEIDTGDFERALDRIRRFEDMLIADGALVVKLWFHLSKKTQRKRLKQDRKHKGRRPLDVSPFTRHFARRYDQFRTAAELALRKTDSGVSPWHVIEAHDHRYRDLAAGTVLLRALRTRLDAPQPPGTAAAPDDVSRSAGPAPRLPEIPGADRTLLDAVDLDQRLDDDAYEEQLEALQGRLNRLTWKAWKARRTTVAVFEGWDAAGKGGAIRRATRAVDARLYRVIQVAAPTDEERDHHYLWRFWRHLPRAGYMTLYDRSWYGRVLVERVEGLAARPEWMRAYSEINDFEEQLCDRGLVLVKFWLHISPEEQLRRFREREATPHKEHKIGPEDWRNREKWDEYEAAVNDMLARTSTPHAPWTLVAGEHKRWARVQVLRTLCDRLEDALD